MKKYLIVIYGKNGCERCVQLKKDVSSILEDDENACDFDLDYQNLSTIAGMQAYALAETVNGQRIPTLQIMKYSEEKQAYMKLTFPGHGADSCGHTVPYYLQAETDYSAANPAISKSKIRELLALARTIS